jgi:hypothetical protein
VDLEVDVPRLGLGVEAEEVLVEPVEPEPIDRWRRSSRASSAAL